MNLKIGCTGWSYEDWAGTFYPKPLDASKYLKYYSSVFEITEVNSTYYQIPSKSLTRKWHQDTPNHFRFSAKFPKAITHENKLDNTKDLIEQFLSSLEPLQEKLFALLFQLPPSLSFDEARPRLDDIFTYLPKNTKYPIEGRHESWFSDNAIQYMRKNNHCLVWNDIESVSNPAPITSDYIYVRLIGDRSISKFDKIVKDRTSEIKSWCEKIKQAESKVNYAFVFANNHYQGFAPATANLIGRSFGMKELLWEEKRQKKLDV